MGHCFSKVVVAIIYFFTFLNWGKRTWNLGKGWLFLIGNGIEIGPLEKGRKSPAYEISTKDSHTGPHIYKSVYCQILLLLLEKLKYYCDMKKQSDHCLHCLCSDEPFVN